jgi:hypothetical protein
VVNVVLGARGEMLGYANVVERAVVGQVTPELLNKIGYGTYIIFGILTTIGAGFIWFFVRCNPCPSPLARISSPLFFRIIPVGLDQPPLLGIRTKAFGCKKEAAC